MNLVVLIIVLLFNIISCSSPNEGITTIPNTVKVKVLYPNGSAAPNANIYVYDDTISTIAFLYKKMYSNSQKLVAKYVTDSLGYYYPEPSFGVDVLVISSDSEFISFSKDVDLNKLDVDTVDTTVWVKGRISNYKNVASKSFVEFDEVPLYGSLDDSGSFSIISLPDSKLTLYYKEIDDSSNITKISFIDSIKTEDDKDVELETEYDYEDILKNLHEEEEEKEE